MNKCLLLEPSTCFDYFLGVTSNFSNEPPFQIFLLLFLPNDTHRHRKHFSSSELHFASSCNDITHEYWLLLTSGHLLVLLLTVTPHIGKSKRNQKDKIKYFRAIKSEGLTVIAYGALYWYTPKIPTIRKAMWMKLAMIGAHMNPKKSNTCLSTTNSWWGRK